MSDGSNHTPPITSVGASDQVGKSFANAEKKGSEAYAVALSMIEELRSFEIGPVNFDTSFTVSSAMLDGFQAPSIPDRPNLSDAFDFDVPDDPGFTDVSVPSFGSAPTFNKEAPTLSFSGKPAPFSGQVPDDAPELFPLTLPDSPDIEFPELPTFESLNLPAPPDITEHTFNETRPIFNEEVPDADKEFDYAFTEYSSALLDQTRDEVSRMLQGGTGLPPAIEQMIFDRSRGREDSTAEKAVMEAMDEYGARGFSLPSGIMDARVREARQRNQEQSNALNRELTIQVHQAEIENLRFAVQQGIALENILTQLHIQSEQIQLQAAQTVVQLALDVFRARVEVYNAEVQAYRADAEVFAQLIRAEISKVEVYRAQLEGERVKGELNQQKLDLYRSRLESLNTLVAVYTSEVNAANTVAQTNETLIRGYASRIDAFRSEVQAKESEFNAWSASIQGELGKIQGYEAETRAFSARTSAYEAGVRAESMEPQIKIERERLKAQQFQARIEGARAEIAAESERVRSLASLYNADASIYAASGQVAASEADANTRQFQAKLQERIATSEQALKNAELEINQLVSLTQQVVQSKQGASQAASQLAAASWSAINASASISERGSATNSWGYDVSHNLTGESVFDAGGD